MIQNITIRVPWTDNNFVGKICNKPCKNLSCLRLRNISEKKDENAEAEISGKSFSEIDFEPPCLSEGAAFMCPVELERTVEHPYKKTNPNLYEHFIPTKETFPPYSLPSRPFIWLMNNSQTENSFKNRIKKYGIDYDQDREPPLDFKTTWVQSKQNQTAIFDTFYKNVIPHKSLCFIYAKQIPFVDDARRVIVGIGFVEEIHSAVEYEYSRPLEKDDVRAMTWETMVVHSIREEGKNGFVFPYAEVSKFAQEHPDFDMTKAVAFASDDYRWQFSYATEHLSHDGTIDSLQNIIATLNYLQEQNVPGNWQEKINWCKARLSEVWEDRGGYSGLGEMLFILGIEKGLLIAEEIKTYIKDRKTTFRSAIDIAFDKRKSFLPADFQDSISQGIIDAWEKLPEERKNLFELLCHFSLTENQAEVAFKIEKRNKVHINLTDKEILENPYLLFERTAQCSEEYRFYVKTVDMAIFPIEKIQKEYPIKTPSALKNGNDKRRIRALLVDYLETQALNGHSVYPIWMCINAISELPIEPECRFNYDILNGCIDFIKEEIHIVETQKKSSEANQNAFQLKRLYEFNELIEEKVIRRIEARKPNIVNADWENLISETFKSDKITDELEAKAREEKAAVLKVLAEARLSVLVGGAGTGKTTLLSVLCKNDDIKNDGILCLSPTGKARVKMEQAFKKQGLECEAKTVAQFLLKTGNFNFWTMNYQFSNKLPEEVPKTVIIDECSMLTEEMFGALLQALSKAKRIILVGDPNQLPPIGTGKPFVDLVNKLSENLSENKFPRVGKSFGELTITRRQTVEAAKKRLDLELAQWYSNSTKNLDEDVFSLLSKNQDEHIAFKEWQTEEELNSLLFETLSEELGMENPDDIAKFNLSLGATPPKKGYQYFNVGCAGKAEDWQILAPVKGMPYGVLNLNHIIHQKYRRSELELAARTYNKKIPSKKGAEGIVYGDKVICTKNDSKREAYPSHEEHYVANGEIGIAMAYFGKPNFLNVEYTSQPNITYGYTEKDFGEENEVTLELAYALTVHKAQGSEFKKVILVLNEPCKLLSKELLYTALTRQIEKLVILYNKDAFDLRTYTSQKYSDIARRFSRLFHVPSIVKLNDKYYEENLIHRTENGEMVRSKSEVIIANTLKSRGIQYEYEKELVFDGVRKIPDFTIEDNETGETFYWEHCGMLDDVKYRERWEKKKRFYSQYGIIEGENLIVSADKNGMIDSMEIAKIIEKYFGK